MIHRFAKFPLFILIAIASPLSFAAHTDWRMVTSSHFFVLADVGEGPAREDALHLEQMRMIFGQMLSKDKIITGVPLDILVLRADEYEKAVPLRNGRAVSMGGFFIPGEDRNYIVLNAEQRDGWRAVAHDYALMLLNYNYPPTQTWFDEGFAQYFAGMRMGEKEGSMGDDPDGSFVATLNSSEWIPVRQLFARKNQPADCNQDIHEKLFCAESWMVMHYIVNTDRLSNAGSYFGAVMLRKTPVDEALRSAFGMTADQLEKAVKDYFHGLGTAGNSTAAAGAAIKLVHPVPLPIAEVGFGSTQDSVEQSRGDSLLAEMMVRLPERRDAAIKEINFLMNGENTENSVEHRALAWLYIKQKKHDQAIEELKDAAELKPNDVWALYYSSLLKYQEAQASGKEYQGLENMFQEMRAVIDWYPEFAQAYNILAMARLDGGGINSATDAIRKAVQLSPRNSVYLLHLAEIYMAAKKWDQATALLQQLKTDDDAQVARSAASNLDNIPYLRKYGILPQDAAEAEKRAVYSQGSDDDDDDSDSPKPVTKPKPDTRPIKFLKGTLLSVDCSVNPGAILKVLAAGKRMVFKTDDYKSLVVVGAPQSSCDWKNMRVAINYKATGGNSGDVVSLELE